MVDGSMLVLCRLTQDGASRWAHHPDVSFANAMASDFATQHTCQSIQRDLGQRALQLRSCGLCGVHRVLGRWRRHLAVRRSPGPRPHLHARINSFVASQHNPMASALQRPLGVGALAPRAALRPPCVRSPPASLPLRAFKPAQRCSARRAAVVVAAGAAAAAPHVQLATARLPADVDVATFNRHLYQWAATLTTNGRNLPFSLPLKADPRDNGFQVRMCMPGGKFCSATPRASQGSGGC